MSEDSDKILAEVRPIRRELKDLNEKFTKILQRTTNAEKSISRSKRAIRGVAGALVFDLVVSVVLIFALDAQHDTQDTIQRFNECQKIAAEQAQVSLLGRSRAAQESAKAAERVANSFVDNAPAAERLAAAREWQAKLQEQIDAQVRFPIVIADCHL